MHNYINFKTATLTDFSSENIEKMYENGFVMTRLGKGIMYQTVSLRISLNEFYLSSENRRVLRKNEDITLQSVSLPLAKPEYDWKIHKLGKDFYSEKFGDRTFSATKIKELITTDHNFTTLLKYYHTSSADPVGYCICIKTPKILHYCYPFYNLKFAADHNNLGIGMMLKTVLYAKENGFEYIYLGSLTREQDKYKLQFQGIQKWDNEQQTFEDIAVK